MPWIKKSMGIREVFRKLLNIRRALIVICAFLLPLPLVISIGTKEAKCGYVVIVMGALWVTEAIPVPVTSLLPIFLFPVFGVMEAKDASESYFKDISFLLLGGLVLSVAVEKWNLHKRLALSILKVVGSQPRVLMLGLMVPTWFLSMWMSNTATAAMMLPIVQAVITQIKRIDLHRDNEEEVEMLTLQNGRLPSTEITEEEYTCSGENYVHITSINDSEENEDMAHRERAQELKKLSKGFVLCIAFAANTGGIATLTGSPPNLVFKAQVDDLYKKYDSSYTDSIITFPTWMSFALPHSFITMLCGWAWLQLLYLRCKCNRDNDPERKLAIKAAIQNEWDKMGRISFGEVVVGILFLFLVFLWLFRQPPNIDGWGSIFFDPVTKKRYVSDSTGAILILVLLFILPGTLPTFKTNSVKEKEDYRPLLDWSTVEKKLPWGIFLLLGGGFAVAKATKVSGLSEWLGTKLSVFSDYDPWVMNLLLCIVGATATEFTTNTATTSLLLPILSSLALSTGVHPLYLMLSSVVACSFAFMLPVATPSNSVVLSSGYIKISDMVLAGLPMNIIALTVLTIMINTWGVYLFDLNTLPAMFQVTTTSMERLSNTSVTMTTMQYAENATGL